MEEDEAPLNFRDALSYSKPIAVNQPVFGKYWDGPIELKRILGFYPRNGILEERCKRILAGLTTKEVGGNRTMLKDLRRVLVYLKGGEIYCECGRLSNHVTACRPRKRRTNEAKQMRLS